MLLMLIVRSTTALFLPPSSPIQCNPMVVDAKEISPTHRACYFWSNLPGMNRPVNPWQSSDRLNLQDCQETNCFRVAQSTKLRTIPTKIRPIEQSKDVEYPVTVKEQENEDWCAEMERLVDQMMKLPRIQVNNRMYYKQISADYV